MPKTYEITEEELIKQVEIICKRNLGRGDVKVCEKCNLLEERISIMKSRGWRVHEKYETLIKEERVDGILNYLRGSTTGLDKVALVIYPDSEDSLREFVKNWDEHAEYFKGKFQDKVYSMIEKAYQEYKK